MSDDPDFEKGKNYIVCSHGDPIYFLVQYLRGEKLRSEFNFGEDIMDDPPDYSPKGSFYVIEKEIKKWKVDNLIKQEEL